MQADRPYLVELVVAQRNSGLCEGLLRGGRDRKGETKRGIGGPHGRWWLLASSHPPPNLPPERDYCKMPNFGGSADRALSGRHPRVCAESAISQWSLEGGRLGGGWDAPSVYTPPPVRPRASTPRRPHAPSVHTPPPARPTPIPSFLPTQKRRNEPQKNHPLSYPRVIGRSVRCPASPSGAKSSTSAPNSARSRAGGSCGG